MANNTKISGIVTCYNEEANIARCLESLAFCDEIIVVDSYSTDKTLEIARKFTDKIYQREYFGSANQKNYALSLAQYPWVLILDADEWLSQALKEEIKAVLRQPNPSIAGYTLHRANFFLGKRIYYSGLQRDRVLRLFLRKRGGYPEKRVHADAQVEGLVGRLKHPLYHNTYVSLSQYFVKFHNYTRWAAAQMWKDKRKGRITSMLFRPPWTFVKNYIFNLGCLDGVHGLVLCMLHSFAVATKYFILWEYHLRHKAGLPLELPPFAEDAQEGIMHR